jgi:hypothetical protein
MAAAPTHASHTAKVTAFAEMVMGMMHLSDVVPLMTVCPADKLTVLHAYPKMCFSFARMMAEKKGADGFYVEGYVVVPRNPMPVWHAWYEDADGNAVDGTCIDAAYPRIGARVPAAKFRKAMANKEFVARYEMYGEMPFHRAAEMSKLDGGSRRGRGGRR